MLPICPTYFFHPEFEFVWEFYNFFFQKNLFTLSHSLTCLLRQGTQEALWRMRGTVRRRGWRENPGFVKIFIQHWLWLDLIRVTQSDQTCISVTVMVEVDPTPPLAATLHSSSGGQNTCASKFFRLIFFHKQFQLIRNPKILQWDLENLLPLLNKSTANNFSDLCVKELYPRRVLNKNWQKKKIREPNFKTNIYS